LKLLDFIIYRARYAAAIISMSTMALLTTLFVLSGTFQPEVLPSYYTSREQILGTVVLLILVPSFLLVFLIAGQRRSMRYAQELFDSGASDQGPDTWLRPIKARTLLIGMGLGLFYALLVNTPLVWLAEFVHSNPLTRSIVTGQAILWTLVGLTLSYRLHTAFSYNKLGRTVRLDLLDARQVAPFAKNGVDDVLAIAILLALSTTQALDAQFRFDNYAAAMLVALPAAAFLFLLPMLSIHRRLVHSRAEYVEAMNSQIASASREFTPEAIQKLEFLMQHRDRVSNTSTWPLDWTIYSRLAFYIILPPIAWLGAAFVEFGVGRILTDP
jgi:putative Mn2+ efflux pump MntP